MINEYYDSRFSWIGEIPSNWKMIPNKRAMKKIKNICDKYDGEDILSLTMNGVIVRDLENPTGKMPESFDGYQKVDTDNLLMCLFDIDVTPRCIGIIKNDGLTSPAYSQFKLFDGFYSKYYYYYYLYLDNYKILLHQSKNLRSSLTESQLGEIKVPVPPYDEQIKIANKLDEELQKIDKTIADNKKVIDLLNSYQQQVINETINKGIKKGKKLKDSNIEWIGEIPFDWNIKRLRFLGSLKSGLSNKKPEDFGHGTPFVAYKDIYKNMSLNNIDGLVEASEEEQKVYSVERGDVFFTGSSETIEELGLSSLCEKTIENATYNGFCIRFRPSTNELYPEYSKYYFRSHCTREFLIRHDNSVTRTNLSQNTLKNVYVLIPPYEEQVEIANYLEKKVKQVQQVIKLRKKIVDKLEEYKKTIIYEYVTGKREA